MVRLIRCLFLIQICLLFSVLMGNSKLYAQMTAQGQGGNAVFWLAFGVEQKLGDRWTSKTDVAFSSRSTLNTWNPFEELGVLPANQEIVFKISKHFKISQGFFYARNHQEKDNIKFAVNEYRFYNKLFFDTQIGKLKISNFLRWAFRIYSTNTNFNPKPFAYRNRLGTKLSYPLGKQEKNYLIAITEFFISTQKKVDASGNSSFSAFIYRENRTSLFYRRKFPTNNMNVLLDLGLMLQTWRKGETNNFHKTVLYQIGLTLQNPFSKKPKNEG